MQVFRLWLPSMAHPLKAGRGALWVSRTRFNPPVFLMRGFAVSTPLFGKPLPLTKPLQNAEAPKRARNAPCLR